MNYKVKMEAHPVQFSPDSQSSEWLLGYVIVFKDGGEPEGQVLHRGTKQSCEELMNNPALAAMCYSGSRPVDFAELRILPA